MKIVRTDNKIIGLLDEVEIGYIDIDISIIITASYIFVEPAYRGGFETRLLIENLLKLSDELHLKIMATCSYINGYLTKNHPEYLN